MIGLKCGAAGAVLVACAGGIYWYGLDRIQLFDTPQVKACEGYIKSRVISAPSYMRLGVDKRAEIITDKELDALRPRPANQRPGEPMLYTVSIEYRDLNPYGVPLDLAGICAFEMRDGKLIDNETGVEAKASAARLRAILFDQAVAGQMPESKASKYRDLPRYPCCL